MSVLYYKMTIDMLVPRKKREHPFSFKKRLNIERKQLLHLFSLHTGCP